MAKTPGVKVDIEVVVGDEILKPIMFQHMVSLGQALVEHRKPREIVALMRQCLDELEAEIDKEEPKEEANG